MRSLRVGISSRDALWTAIAALAGAAAFPPISFWPLSLVSIAVFIWLLRGKNSSEARAVGLVYGAVYGLGTMYWLFGIFGFLAVSFVGLMAGYFGILATLIGMTKDRSLFVRVLLVGVFAVAIEWLRGDAWYLRFPWYTVPHALVASPMWTAPVRWIGTYGLSFVLWSVAALGAFGRPRYWLGFCLVPASWLLLPPVQPPDRMALLMQVEESYLVESLIKDAPSGKFDLVVLPEYAFPQGYRSLLSSPRGPAALARKLSCPVVFGTVDGSYGEPGFQNVAGVLDAKGEFVGVFPKQRPVPLMLDGKPGTTRPVFRVGDQMLGIGICYDFDAPEIAGSVVHDGATVLVAPVGDLMTWGRIQHIHHELLARLRALENDRWVLRATSSGRSEAISPHGVPSAECLEIGETGTVTVTYGDRRTTPWGGQMHFLGPAAGVATAVFVLVQMGRYFRSRFRRDRIVSDGAIK
jgi:apolipoprotein N-acyltransferase